MYTISKTPQVIMHSLLSSYVMSFLNVSLILFLFSIVTSFLCETRRRDMSSSNTIRDDSLKYYSRVTKLVHYTSKFALNEDGRQSKQHPSTKNHRFSLNFDLTDKFVFSQISITRILILKKKVIYSMNPSF